MLRVHQRFCASVVLGSAMLCGFGLPAMAGSYHVDGTIGEFRNGVYQHLYIDYSKDLGVQAGGQVNYDPFSGVHAQADSIAESYGVHSHTYSQLIIPVVGGSYEVDMTVSGPFGGTVSTSINLNLSGGSLVGSGADPGSLGYANTNLAVWVFVNGTVVGSGFRYDRADTRFGPTTSSNGMLSSWGSANPGIVTPNFNVQSGVPFEVKVQLSTDADTIISSAVGSGGTAEANADYSHTFSFAQSGAVFNLPSGYTANSTDAHIVGNQVAVVPGDFSRDGTVNAADYVAWRKGLGTAYTQDDYTTWRAHFGQTSGGSGAGRSSQVVVPEPSTLALSVLAATYLISGTMTAPDRRRI
jgi:hypothetical protein